jgi:hypothetical protein
MCKLKILSKNDWLGPLTVLAVVNYNVIVHFAETRVIAQKHPQHGDLFDYKCEAELGKKNH